MRQLDNCWACRIRIRYTLMALWSGLRRSYPLMSAFHKLRSDHQGHGTDVSWRTTEMKMCSYAERHKKKKEEKRYRANCIEENQPPRTRYKIFAIYFSWQILTHGCWATLFSLRVSDASCCILYLHFSPSACCLMSSEPVTLSTVFAWGASMVSYNVYTQYVYAIALKLQKNGRVGKTFSRASIKKKRRKTRRNKHHWQKP